MHRVVPEPPVNKRDASGLPHPTSLLLPRTVRLFRPYRFQVVLVAVLILVTASIGVVNPLLIKVVFDAGLFPESGGPDLNLLWILAAIMTSIAIVNGIMGVVQVHLITILDGLNQDVRCEQLLGARTYTPLGMPA